MKRLMIAFLFLTSFTSSASNYDVNINQTVTSVYGGYSKIVISISEAPGYVWKEPLPVMRQRERDKFNHWYNSKEFRELNLGYKRNACTDMGYGYHDCAVQEIENVVH